ncbi:dihydrofolate reductase family protein [Hephaestia mangrovi]|uniref:dihydrofolate reductase family protein n=1 Tax=Hephaestia mangrovi TaxID=2873268 RepID=UPI001CA64CB8|nr:dihydrofolate reductase family protein [Hephaestia mangrovi]MBY8828968.1 dihydrofolate reductase family protein [Hephaestia mangrovi]
MRKVIGSVFQSLDGVMQAPGGPREDWTGGFELGGWMFPLADEATGAWIGELFGGAYDLLLGRKTYEIFAAYWPYVDDGNPIAKGFNAATKYVLTRGDDPLPWENSHRLADIAAVAALKQGDGPDLIIQGSSTLYPTLLEAGLLDQLTTLTYPVVLGPGKRVFGAGTPPRTLKLVRHQVSPGGTIIAHYEPAGEVETGSFAAIEPNAREEARQQRMKRKD